MALDLDFSERATGIEPAFSAWEGAVAPFADLVFRVFGLVRHHFGLTVCARLRPGVTGFDRPLWHECGTPTPHQASPDSASSALTNQPTTRRRRRVVFVKDPQPTSWCLRSPSIIGRRERLGSGRPPMHGGAKPAASLAE